MRSNCIIYLIGNETTYDSIGNSVNKKTERKAFANKYQVSASEFYSENINNKSGQQTIRGKTSFQIRSNSYKGEDQYRYGDKVYDIIRASDLGEYTLLVGGEKIGKK